MYISCYGLEMNEESFRIPVFHARVLCVVCHVVLVCLPVIGAKASGELFGGWVHVVDEVL